MKYKINARPDGVSVDRISNRKARQPWLIISAISFIIAFVGGVSLMQINWNSSESGNPETALLIGSLLSILCLGYALVVGRLMQRMPERVFFNNERAMVEITHAASVAGTIEIPYQEVDSVASRRITWWDRSSKKYNSRYAVAMQLKDGTLWDLIDDSIVTGSYADDFAHEISRHTLLDKVATEKPALPKPGRRKILLVNRGEEVQIGWENNFPQGIFMRIFKLFIFLGVASFISLTLISVEVGWDVVGNAFGAVMEDLRLIGNLPGQLGIWLCMALGVWLLLVLRLFFVIFSIFKFRLGKHVLIVNKSSVCSPTLDLNLSGSDIKGVYFNYYISEGVQPLTFANKAYARKTDERFQASDIDFSSASSMIGTALTVFTKEAVKEVFKKSDDTDQEVVLGTLAFDKHSPLDVYVIKEAIKKFVTVG